MKKILEQINLLIFKAENNLILSKSAGWLVTTITRYWFYAAILAFCTGTFFFLSFAVDDSFIYLRYAKTLKEYGVWNWNPTSKDLVEAYTGAVYVVLPIIPIFLNIPPLLFLDLVGLLLLFIMVRQIIRTASDKYLKSYLVLLFLLAPITYMHFYSGLETPLFILLTFEIFRLFYQLWHDNEKKNFNYFYFLCLAIALTRSDGAIIAVILFTVLLLKNRFRIYNFKSLFLWGGLGLAYFIWRYSYFGHLLPAPAYHKLVNGTAAIGPNIQSAKLYLIPVLLLIFVWIRQRNIPALIISAVILIISWMYINSRLEMNYADRFFYHICIPGLLFLISLIKLNELRFKNIFILLSIALLFFIAQRGFNNIYVQSYTYSLYNSYGKIGKALAKFDHNNYTLLTGDCGLVPYESGWYVYDSMGLANMEVARQGLTRKFLDEHKPDAIIMYAEKDGMPTKDTLFADKERMQTILNYINESGEYSYVDSFTSGNYYNAIFIKKNLPDFAELNSELKKQAAYTKNMFAMAEPFAMKKIVGFIISGQWLSL